MKIGILNLEINNIKNIYAALKILGNAYIINNVNEYKSGTDLLVLPGNGKFEHGMKNIKLKKFDFLIKEISSNNKKILGICLGMQLMMNSSEESEKIEGLGIIDGSVKLISKDLAKIPLLGWYDVNFKDQTFKNNAFFFNNKYMVVPKDESLIIGKIEDKLPAVFYKKNIYGIQFHPEKSSKHGLEFLKLIIEK